MNYHYAYQRQSAPHATNGLQHIDSYSPSSSSDGSPFSYQCHSHPPGLYASQNGNVYGASHGLSLSGSAEITPVTSKLNPLPGALTFRIVGATRNTYYMDYVVEVITPELRWLVYRRYSNFSLLNAKLLKLGLAHPTKNVMPPKQFSLPPLASPFASDDLVQKRIDGLGAFLNSLAADNSQFFLNHPIGQTFLDPHVSSSEHNKVVNSISKSNK
eukprot:Phypoly_transcript_09341.p1 GENE.Phypoly_transcript_09341~~Phypoly_transcript_09341.p1  ORF type:complete len:240 (+),score=41.49 Phypoly_transcript_09341:79-720(+)